MIAKDSIFWDVFRRAWRLGYHATGIPADFGGGGLAGVETHIFLEELGWGSADFAIGIGVAGLPFTVLATLRPDLFERYAKPFVEDTDSPLLLGLITDRDITVRCVAEGHAPSCLVRNHMTARPLQTVSPEANVSEVIEKMETAQVRRIPVVNPDGVLLGIIAQADVATKVGPKQPRAIEELLERISAAAVDVA